MTDNTESPQKTPLSSSSSNPSGTQALSVSIDEEVQEQRVEGSEEALSKGEAATEERQDAPAADNENDPSYGRSETEEVGTGTGVSGNTDIEDAALFSGSADDDAQAGGIPTELTPEHGEAEDTTPEPECHADVADLETDASGVSAPEPAHVIDEMDEALQMASADDPVEPEIADDELPSEVYEPSRSDIRVETDGLMTGEPTTEDLREAVRNTLAERTAENEKAFALFNQMSHDLRAAMEDARDDAARVSFKLMEFAQASFHNNVELARDYAAARSVPDLFNVQSSYIQRQLELMNSKTQELQALTKEISSKKAEKLEHRLKAE